MIMIQCCVVTQAHLLSTILLEHMKVSTLVMPASLTAILTVTVFMYLLKPYHQQVKKQYKRLGCLVGYFNNVTVISYCAT